MRFVIYKYDFKPVPACPSLLPEEKKPLTAITEAQDLLARILGAPRLSPTSGRQGNPVTHENKIRRTQNDPTLIDICAVRHVTLTKDYKTHVEEDNPFCRVVIDNRAGVAQMAIEKKSTAFDDTNRVSAIIAEGLNHTLAPYGLKIEIRPKTRTRDFWGTVNSQIGLGDVVKSVSFEFDNPLETRPVDASKALRERLAGIHALTAALRGARAVWSVTSQGGGDLRLDEANEDLAQMVALCCNNGYTIGVKFSKMGLIRVGETGLAAFTVDDRVVRDFEQGMPLPTDRETDPVYELENSMEKIRIQTGA